MASITLDNRGTGAGGEGSGRLRKRMTKFSITLQIFGQGQSCPKLEGE
jgi:hypothetical protein